VTGRDTTWENEEMGEVRFQGNGVGKRRLTRGREVSEKMESSETTANERTSANHPHTSEQNTGFQCSTRSHVAFGVSRTRMAAGQVMG